MRRFRGIGRFLRGHRRVKRTSPPPIDSGNHQPPPEPPPKPRESAGVLERFPFIGDDLWLQAPLSDKHKKWYFRQALRAGQTPWKKISPGLYAQAGRGSRGPWEKIKVNRHRRFQPLAIAAALDLEGRRNESLWGLRESIQAVIEEPRWCDPWFELGRGQISAPHEIDLEAIAVMQDLAAATYLLDDLEIHQDVASEFEARIREPFERYLAGIGKRPSWWNIGNNWEPDIYAGIVASMALLGIEVPKEWQEQIDFALSHYFAKSFGPDGYPYEGSVYAEKGLRAVLLHDSVVGGQTNTSIFYESLTRLSFFDGSTPPFGDAKFGNKMSWWLCDYASKAYPQLQRPWWEPEFGFPSLPVALLFLFAESVEDRLETNQPSPFSLFKQSGVSVNRKLPESTSGIEFAATWANNGMAIHGHRDIGSWTMQVNGYQVAGDPGPPKYGNGNFSKARWENPANSALGHPVVIVNGLDQAELGSSAKGDLASAFRPEIGCESWVRSIGQIESKQKITIFDRLVFNKEPKEVRIQSPYPTKNGIKASFVGEIIRVEDEPFPSDLKAGPWRMRYAIVRPIKEGNKWRVEAQTILEIGK